MKHKMVCVVMRSIEEVKKSQIPVFARSKGLYMYMYASNNYMIFINNTDTYQTVLNTRSFVKLANGLNPTLLCPHQTMR